MSQFSVDAAVTFLGKCFTKDYRSQCVRHWIDVYGEDFARKVVAKYRAKKKNGL